MHISLMGYRKIDFCVNLLRIVYGLLFIVVGLDKFFMVVTDWSKYVSPQLMAALPVALVTFLQVFGVIEILVGLYILFVRRCGGGFAAAILLVLIAINLLMFGRLYLDIAVRDLVMAVGAIVLAKLNCVKHEITE